MSASVRFTVDLETLDGRQRKTVSVEQAVVGGWTGRDKAALRHHMEELAKIGVTPPEHTPVFYRVGVSRLTAADTIQVIGDASSGEVEYVLLKTDGRVWVGAGSDHTDRAIEHVGITVAKQLCDKPIAMTFWPLDEVAGHWEKLKLKSYIDESSGRVLYQDGSVSNLLSPSELLDTYKKAGHEFSDGTLMFGGTCGAIGEIRFAPRFELELTDPVLGRTIRHAYSVEPVPIRG